MLLGVLDTVVQGVVGIVLGIVVLNAGVKISWSIARVQEYNRAVRSTSIFSRSKSSTPSGGVRRDGSLPTLSTLQLQLQYLPAELEKL